MEWVTANLAAARASRRVWGGREYLVVPLTSLVPGVLEGSQGPLFYPEDEVSRNVGDWDGVPLTVGHPVRNGQNVSARDPDVLEKQGVGYVFRSRFAGALKHEAWVDVEAARRVDSRVLAALESGQPLEVSTGLFTENEIHNTRSYNGRSYRHTARKYRPDHVAILPDARGACSLRDGCGVLVNAAHESFSPERWHEYAAPLVTNARAKVSPAKACEILKDGTVHGKPLSRKQRGMFGALCGKSMKTNALPEGFWEQESRQ